jgi:outer membrane protein OmpA-like peptidoglycan-associated protein/Mg-chelatase subunit ChlD
MIGNLAPHVRRLILIGALITALWLCAPLKGSAQPSTDSTNTGTSGYTTLILRDSTLHVSIRNIDITRFPIISLVFDVFDSANHPVTTLQKKDLIIKENGQPQDVISLSTTTRTNRVPIDFVFVIDQTGSMGSKIEGVKQNIDQFTTRLAEKGIDYRLGLIAFDDNVAERHWLTDNIDEFKGWVGALEAHGGGDEKENALEALRAATGMNFRSSANRCVVLITDAPYHQYGEHGYGRTMYTTRTISTVLMRYEMRTFCIVSPAVLGYRMIAESTDGQVFDINQPFADILNQFVSTMTALNTATYKSSADLIPDSIKVELQIPGAKITVKKNFAVLEVGRKLVVDNIQFATNQYTIEPGSQSGLDYLVRLMRARPTLKLRIEGFTDNVGDHDKNMRLSSQRADAVRTYMMQHGIAMNRLFTIGYGETRPTATNDTEEGRHLNRRTEFIIMQK